MTSDPSQGVLPGTTTLRVGELLLDREIMDSSVADRLAERFAGSRRDRSGIEGQIRIIRAAYAVAYAAHSGQCRQSGEAYIEHPVAVARRRGRGWRGEYTLAGV